MADNTCIYRIDADNRITVVSGNWLSFARENGAEESCHPKAILNRPIWEFIDGHETRHLYEIILARLRKAGRPVTVPFRCDAPDKRRYLALAMVPSRDNDIDFYSSIIREESREPVALLSLDAPRSDEIIKMCSTCKKIELGGNRWVEVEVGVVELQLFEAEKLPRISHGLCGDCYNNWVASFETICPLEPAQ